MHNILNRFPDKSRLQLFVKILKELNKYGIVNPASKSSLYQVAKLFSVTEYEIRFDFAYEKIDYFKLEEIADKYEETLYFTDRKARTRMRLYPYPGYLRFEMIFTRNDGIKGTAMQIINKLPIDSTLSRNKVLRNQLLRVKENPVNLQNLGLSGFDLFLLSQLKNGNDSKFL